MKHSSENPCRRRRAQRIAAIVIGTMAMAAPASRAEQRTQKLPLLSGWNLVTFQVGPASPSPAEVFATLGPEFVQAMTFDAPSQTWIQFTNPADPGAAGKNAVLGSITQLEAGHAYYIQMRQAAPDWTVTGTAFDAATSIALSAGWNLIGIPVGKDDIGVPFDLSSYFGNASGIPLLTRVDASGHRKLTMNGMTGDDDFSEADPNRGYWVYSNEAQTIHPNPLAFPAVATFATTESTLLCSAGAGSVEVRFSKPYIGKLDYEIRGTAVPGRHFILSAGQLSGNGIVTGSLNVNGSTALIPILPVDRQQFTGPATLSVAITGYRSVRDQSARFALPAQTTPNAEAVTLGTKVRQFSDLSVWQVIDPGKLNLPAGWQQVAASSYVFGSPACHLIKLIEADKGLYSGMIRFADGANLAPQPVRVAFRSNGTAVFDVSQAPLFGVTNFSLPVTYPAGGRPQFHGAITDLRTMASGALGRTVSWRLSLNEPAALVPTVADKAARYALTGLTLGSLVRQQSPTPETLWRVADPARIGSSVGWKAADEAAWNLNATLTLTGLTATPGGHTLGGVLRLDQLHP